VPTSPPPATAHSDDLPASWDELGRIERLRLTAANTARTLAAAAALLIAYFWFPTDRDPTVGVFVVLAGGLAAFAMVTVLQIRQLKRAPYPLLRGVQALLMVSLMFIVAFSLTYVLMAEADPESFSEPMTKSAAIYFTVTTVATVGFGDIVATTDTTRLVVTVQMLMGIGILATTARVVLSATQNRHQALRDARAARPDTDE
jgi:hypothetical protein